MSALLISVLKVHTQQIHFAIWNKYNFAIQDRYIFKCDKNTFCSLVHSPRRLNMYCTAAGAAAYIAVFAAAVASWQRMCCCTLPPPTSRHTWTLFTLLHICSLQHLHICIFAHLLTCTFICLQTQCYACRLANAMEHISVHFKEAAPRTKHCVLLDCNAW